jgi:ribosome-binding protein aMBF1 (putative translation factor)
MTSQEMRIARINRGVSIRGLAREIDVPEQSIRRIEAGRLISLPYAKKLADWHGVQVTDILPVAQPERSVA